MIKKIWDIIHWGKFDHKEVDAINYKENLQNGNSPVVTLVPFLLLPNS